MKIHPYLNFNGQCEEAFRLYERCLGGKIGFMMPYKGTPMAGHMPENWDDKILHAALTVDGEMILGSDAPPDRYEKPQSTYVSLQIDTVEETDRIFNELSAGGSIVMPIQKTFWADRFGMFTDRFGTPWMVNCEGSARTA